MAELLLTHGYFLYEDPKELQIMKPYAPLGILYLCSHLRQKGFDVDVFDTTFSSREALFQHLRSEKPSVLGDLRQFDDAQERGRNSQGGARGGLEDDCRRSGTRRLRSGVPAGGSGFRGVRRRRAHGGRIARVISCWSNASLRRKPLPASLTSMPRARCRRPRNAHRSPISTANPGRPGRLSTSTAM